MSKFKSKIKDIIFFDASIRDGVCGIGIWDLKRQAKVYKSYMIQKDCSLTGETMALLTAMEYAWENKINNPILLTDNQPLADRGIPKRFKRKFGGARLHWIPRELNEEADALSKEGRLVSKIPLASITQKTTDKNNDINDIAKKIQKYSRDRKANLLKRLATTEYQMSLVQFYESQSKEILDTFNPQYDNKFVLFFNTIRKSCEIHKDNKKRLFQSHGVQDGMRGDLIEKYLRESNLI